MAGGPQRQVYRFPTYQAGFRGLLDREGITDESFQGGFLDICTNFHLIGRGRLKKRRGHRRLIAALPGGANPIQGLAMYEFATTRHLISVVNATIKQLAGAAWTDITGGLTIGSGQDVLTRFTQFGQGSVGSFIVGTGGGNNPMWKWDGTASPAELLIPTTGTGPAYASDVEEFYGRLWAVGTNSGNTITEYSDDGRADFWPPENAFHATRESPAVGLSRHNDGVLLIFHQHSIHRIEPVYDSQFGDPFGRYLVDNSVGAESPHGIVSSSGATYFVARAGIHQIKDAQYPARYIGWPIEEFWNRLNPDRIRFISGFKRGEPWNEIVWLCATGSNTQNNAAIVYNTELDAWSIFDQTDGTMKFNAGVNWVNSAGKETTVVGDYIGIVSSAWGDDQFDTGNVDGLNDAQSPISTNFKTGALEMGYAGLKRLREMWIDLSLSDTKTFQFTINSLASGNSVSHTQNIGAAGATFGSFVFGTSAFAGDTPKQAKIIKSAKAQLFQLQLQESSEGLPFTLNAIRFWWRPSGRRIKAIA